MNNKLLVLVCMVLSASVINHAYSQCELDILIASDAETSEFFGGAVAIEGDIMVIGAYREDATAYSAGALYIFRQFNSTWNETTKLLASDGEQFDEFGRAVDISGNFVIVGAHKNDGEGFNQGAAYIFRYYPESDEWVEQIKLLAVDGSTNDEFGFFVAICGDVAIVGSLKHNHAGGPYGGAVYVFRSIEGGQEWELEAELQAEDGAANDRFGRSVDIDGDLIVIGASQNDDNGSKSGAAYIFRYDLKSPDKWVQEQKLLPQVGNMFAQFGGSVSINGQVCAIGANRALSKAGYTGAAYIFRYDDKLQNWCEEAKVLASDGDDADRFGIVALDGNVLVVGAPDQSMPAQNAGAVYVYEYQDDSATWIEQGKLVASDNEVNTKFGSAVAIANTLGIAGSPEHNGAAPNAGAAYTFNTLAQEDINNNGIPDACEIGFADLNSDGVVNTSDLLILLGFWGLCPGSPLECLGDLNEDQIVSTVDLLILLENWG